ncbi:ATPase [Erythrobacter litoralis]|uniref:ATPase n=1 Tax=Erythrobacter litoralis TaxID=39960 RepID=UPI00243503D8|nr:ATPase [Erythrobacter litoralis]MDG6078235.1 ATPase [Erythrobacter litoralis]
MRVDLIAMDKRSHIRAVEEAASQRQGPPPPEADPVEEHAAEVDDPTASDVWTASSYEDVEEAGGTSTGTAVSILALIAVTAWTGLFFWSNRSEILGGAPIAQWVDWIATWAVPVLLVIAICLLILRTSTREAKRFANIAAALSNESAILEARLATVNRELSLAREFLSAQSRELSYFGRAAAEGITRHAETLETLLRENGGQFEAIESVSENALTNMEKLRDQLPVIANSSRDVSNQIGNAGRIASDQLEHLINGFERLNEFGTASERQVISLREQVNETLEALELRAGEIEGTVSARFVALREETDTFSAALGEREAANLEALRSRAEAMRNLLDEVHEGSRKSGEVSLEIFKSRLADVRQDADALERMLSEQNQAARNAWLGHIEEVEDRHRALLTGIGKETSKLHSALNEAIDEAKTKIAGIDEGLEQRRVLHRDRLEDLAREAEGVADRIDKASATLGAVSEQTRETQGTLMAAITELRATLDGSREALDGTDMAIAALTDAGVRLLELLQASARQSRDELPSALSSSEDHLRTIEERSKQVRSVIQDAQQSGEALHERLSSIDGRTQGVIGFISKFQSEFGHGTEIQIAEIDRLREAVRDLANENNEVAEKTQNDLRASFEIVEKAARDALASFSDEHDARIQEIADRIGRNSAAAIDSAVTEHLDGALNSLDLARERSSSAAQDAAEQLRDQLSKIDELTDNLETRVARARTEAQERIDNDFSRRVALITESLNSSSIDVAKALSTDVSDTAWTSYLKGDRGIFTRRAVRLIENSEAREIAAIYNDDADFREHVNRYIHDFESMLRTLLSTRDGNALSVTMLSSDMGKLYVILAQALERLRQ